jgi:chemotaxis protein MotA
MNDKTKNDDNSTDDLDQEDIENVDSKTDVEDDDGVDSDTTTSSDQDTADGDSDAYEVKHYKISDEDGDDDGDSDASTSASDESAAPKEGRKAKRKFFPLFNKGTPEIKQTSAGAGFIGLVGFATMLLVASVFFITENYFISMFTISIGLLIYVAGMDLIILAFSTFVIFFSSKHLNNRATAMQETVVALKNILNIKRGRDGNVSSGPIDSKVSIELPDNPLSRDIQELVMSGKTFDYAEFVAHYYYQECHELYESSSSNFDFVSATMPLFGLIGTIIGLIAMFDSLGSDVTVESLSPQLALALKTTLYGAIFSSFYKIIGTRFERRMVDLDYDYDAFCRALQVIVENKNRVEINH